jgi:hypothetical protein
VIRELSERGEYIFRRALGTTEHGMVGVVFECDAVEETGDDGGCEAL